MPSRSRPGTAWFLFFRGAEAACPLPRRRSRFPEPLPPSFSCAAGGVSPAAMHSVTQGEVDVQGVMMLHHRLSVRDRRLVTGLAEELHGRFDEGMSARRVGYLAVRCTTVGTDIAGYSDTAFTVFFQHLLREDRTGTVDRRGAGRVVRHRRTDRSCRCRRRIIRRRHRCRRLLMRDLLDHMLLWRRLNLDLRRRYVRRRRRRHLRRRRRWRRRRRLLRLRDDLCLDRGMELFDDFRTQPVHQGVDHNDVEKHSDCDADDVLRRASLLLGVVHRLCHSKPSVLCPTPLAARGADRLDIIATAPCDLRFGQASVWPTHPEMFTMLPAHGTRANWAKVRHCCQVSFVASVPFSGLRGFAYQGYGTLRHSETEH